MTFARCGDGVQSGPRPSSPSTRLGWWSGSIPGTVQKKRWACSPSSRAAGGCWSSASAAPRRCRTMPSRTSPSGSRPSRTTRCEPTPRAWPPPPTPRTPRTPLRRCVPSTLGTAPFSSRRTRTWRRHVPPSACGAHTPACASARRAGWGRVRACGRASSALSRRRAASASCSSSATHWAAVSPRCARTTCSRACPSWRSPPAAPRCSPLPRRCAAR